MERNHLSSPSESCPTNTSKTPLPNELIIKVLSHLEKHELKIARLVCKTWSHFASEPLFNKLYISPREEDIKVFKLVTQHPQLRRCVTTLEYDATRFSPDVTISTYIRKLLDCAMDRRENDDFTDMRQIRKREDFDPQIDEYLDECQSSLNLGDPWVVERFKDFGFVIEGCRRWQECAAYQQKCLNSGDFLRILVYGLRNLNRLESVLMCQEWNLRPAYPLGSLLAHYYNSPFGRTWHIFRAQPMGWSHDGALADGFDNFWLLTTALVHAQTRLRRFNTTSLPPIVFDTMEHATESMVEYSVDAYSRLEHLSLMLGRDGLSRGEPLSKLDKLSGLQTLLRSMTGLKTLNLGILEDSYKKKDIALERVLPTSEVHWNELTSFRLCRVAAPAKDLVQLLTVRMSKLQVLHFLEIQLVEGSWEAVIESMKTSMHLRRFSIAECWASVRGSTTYQSWEKWKKSPSKQSEDVRNSDVEEYVLGGGRHPFLLPDEPDWASEKYLSAPWL